MLVRYLLTHDLRYVFELNLRVIIVFLGSAMLCLEVRTPGLVYFIWLSGLSFCDLSTCTFQPALEKGQLAACTIYWLCIDSEPMPTRGEHVPLLLFIIYVIHLNLSQRCWATHWAPRIWRLVLTLDHETSTDAEAIVNWPLTGNFEFRRPWYVFASINFIHWPVYSFQNRDAETIVQRLGPTFVRTGINQLFYLHEHLHIYICLLGCENPPFTAVTRP
jgi:hypothetical protein